MDRLTDSLITQERCGLVWIEFLDRDQETGDPFMCWLLVQTSTDRVLVTIDGPAPGKIVYATAVEGCGGRRFYISLDGAKRNALSVAMQILGDERKESAQRRKQRRTEKVTKSD